ncbi:MAG TPA: magnesium transporter [Gemmatimonadales bacterium]|nr:magnesium transporter [Gemmatimonadales bacterium]
MSDVTERARAVDALVALVRRGALVEFARLAVELEPADLADVLAALDDDERVAVVQMLPPEISSQALIEMPEEEHPEDTLASLDAEQAAEIVGELADDDAADILGELEPAEQERILAAVEDVERANVEKLLVYDEESAGGLMTSRVVSVADTATVGQALDEVRRQSEEVEEFYDVYVVDHRRRLLGVLPFRSLAVTPPFRAVRDIMEEPPAKVGPEEDQEEVARVMARYNLASIPVVDTDGRLLGCVTFDDVSDVVEAENTEDILRFGGVSAGEELRGPWLSAVRSRLPWLVVNLVTAFAAGAVVLSQQEVISRIVLLAAYMPIIAGMGGNTGTQALAVTVRGLALGLIPPSEAIRVVGKEMLAGMVNGVSIGLITACTALVLGHGAKLGLVVFLAMAGNLLVAGFAGAFIPILLERLRVDPAVASSIFVTTFTDICGFSLLLGLASAVLL